MISFYYHRKDKRTSYPCEDSLTATLFDTLKHLPSNLLWGIIKKSLIKGTLPAESGELLSISFWDKWDAINTSNINFVEPDVFLRFEKLDLIVEAKRYDSFQQKDYQIINEIIAYFNMYKEDEKDMYFLQLGGLQDTDFYHENLKDYKFEMCKTNWTTFLEQIVIKNDEFEDDKQSKSYSRILGDVIYGFELHQFFKKDWLKDLPLIELNIESFNNFKYLKKLPKTKSLSLIPHTEINITEFNYYHYGK